MKQTMLGLLVGILLLSGCTTTAENNFDANPAGPLAGDPLGSPDPGTDASVPEAGAALGVVDLLEVKGRAPKTGYDRDLFGDGWLDLDGDGCQTRDEMLARDLDDTTTEDGCTVTRGMFPDPYSGEIIQFERGVETSTLVQIDHVVALSDAWQKGAQGWDEATRQQFANDPLNLLASKGVLNSQKGDGDTATWLPPNKMFVCEYVARQVAVKFKYGVWVTEAERDAMKNVLSECPTEELPDLGGMNRTKNAPESGESTQVPESPTSEVPVEGATDPDMGSCAKAKAAGYGPYSADDLEYSFYKDGDGDGTVCE